MKAKWFFKKIGLGLLFAAFIVGVGFVFMLLWNWLVPSLFGGVEITFWQSLGLLFLIKIGGAIFRGGRRPGGSHRWKSRMRSKWQNMTPEEQAKWREKYRNHPCNRRRERENTQLQTPDGQAVDIDPQPQE